MISQVQSTTIPVAGQDAALDFYATTLGWDKAMDAPVEEELHWLTIVPPRATTQLVLAQAGGGGRGTPSYQSHWYHTRCHRYRGHARDPDGA